MTYLGFSNMTYSMPVADSTVSQQVKDLDVDVTALPEKPFPWWLIVAAWVILWST
jgi:hypothetical protein